jgi:uncharacterized protein YjbI with pentapeptide repeats
MANPDHLEMLRQKKIQFWNARRMSLIAPDYSDADLCGADLHDADLRGADLRNANFNEANLYRADLSWTWLSGAYLNGANLHRAELSGAVLNGANLSGANLSGANLGMNFHGLQGETRRTALAGANLSGANLSEASFHGSELHRADLSGANLSGAYLVQASLRLANLSAANLSGANLTDADLYGADLTGANLAGANLQGGSLLETNCSDADLTGCRVYGISAWKVVLSKKTKQQNLIITKFGELEVTVDDIELAQFMYLLLYNEKIRNVIDTITSKVVLILGRFSKERKTVLDAIRDELRTRDLLPVIFDFSIPASRDVTDTVKVLASLARFVIADITNATEVRAELHNIIPQFTSLPVQMILLRGQRKFVSQRHLESYPWVLPVFEYETKEHLLANLDQNVLGPAEAKVLELRQGVASKSR